MNAFTIKQQHFEGPLDLLLDLVEKRRLYINDISLGEVTDEYLKYVESIPSVEIAERAEFIVVASTLLLIKSKSLLPSLDLTQDEEDTIEDLERRLKILQTIRESSKSIQDIFGKKMIFSKENINIKTVVFSPHQTISLDSISRSLEAILNRLPKKQELPKAIVKKVISLEEMIDKLSTRIQSGLSLSFKQFSGHSDTIDREKRVEIVVSFLAMLELVKQGIVNVAQENHFDDIRMETTTIGVPRY